jgi:hypothetical protein
MASLATSPVVLFVALPETESTSDPGINGPCGSSRRKNPESRDAADLALQCSDVAMQYIVGSQAGPVVAISASVPYEARQLRIAHPIQFFHAAEARYVEPSLLHPAGLFRFGGRVAPRHYGEFLWRIQPEVGGVPARRQRPPAL